MSFTTLTGNLWSRIQAWVAKPASRNRRRRRIEPISTVAAQVEKLESRQLLSVTYQGGALLAHVEAQPIYFGSDWTATSDLQTEHAQLDQFTSSVVNSSFMDMLGNAGYNVGRGTSTAGVVDNITLSKTTAVTDAQIQGRIQALINSGQLRAPDANRVYVTYVEPGVLVQYGGSSSNASFLGYHSAFAGKTASGAAIDVHYIVVAYPGSPNFAASASGFTTDLNQLTTVTSHELAETVTDPNVNYKQAGWMDPQANEEIADLAVGHYVVLNGYEVSGVVNQQGVVVTPLTQQTPPPTGLMAPIVTGAASSSTSAQLSWKSVASVEGYRVYKMNGSQLQLLGSVPSGTLSYTINSLSASTKYAFLVEAYRGTGSVDSSAVSVSTPAPAALAQPQLTASALNSTIAFLSWNPVAGATAYRIYYAVGTGSRVLLGVENSSQAIGGKFYASVTGLVPGSSVRFMIEAYNSTQVGDSIWIACKMPLA
jgi:hypothetical protein